MTDDTEYLKYRIKQLEELLNVSTQAKVGLLRELSEAKAAALASAKVRGGGWLPTHRHLKRGSSYRKIGTALLQSGEPIGEACSLVIYQSENGRLWARPEVEFDDGRFEPLSASPNPRRNER